MADVYFSNLEKCYKIHISKNVSLADAILRELFGIPNDFESREDAEVYMIKIERLY